MINLSGYSAIETAVFVKWEVPNFSTAYVSDYYTSETFDGNTYTNIGNLLSITSIPSELKPTKGEITVTLSGVPTNSIPDILAQEIKGSKIWIYRGYYEAGTHAPINFGAGDNIVLQFKGIVTNYSISDNIEDNGIATSSIVLTCNSPVELLSTKYSGRKTNQTDFPGVQDMARVQALANSNFNFGAP